MHIELPHHPGVGHDAALPPPRAHEPGTTIRLNPKSQEPS